MPQIAQLAATYSSQIFWILLTFGFVFFVIGLGMVPKVQSTIDARDSKIADDLAAAKANSAAADTLEANWRAKENEARSAAQAQMVAAKAEAMRNREAALASADGVIGEKLGERIGLQIANRRPIGQGHVHLLRIRQPLSLHTCRCQRDSPA